MSTSEPHPADVAQWSTATRLAFRFTFLYFGLYVITTQMLGGFFPQPFMEIDLSALPPMKQVVLFVGEHLLPLSKPVTVHTSGSGDKLYDYVQVVALLLIALVGTVVWSWRAQGRVNHERLFRWFRLFMRIALATTMLTYGLIKVIPLQMSTLQLGALVEPFGSFSPMGVLWNSVGASPAYEIFIGAAETLAGVLLLLPRTTLLGALVSLSVATGVFVVNMTYDVPVKLFSFHMVLIALLLIAPDARRLCAMFLWNRAVAPAPDRMVGGTPRARRNARIAVMVFGAIALCVGLYSNMQAWKEYGGGAPRPPLFGIWAIEEMQRDSVVTPLVVTDTTLWRHFIVPSSQYVRVQFMNDNMFGYASTVDTTRRTLVLSTMYPSPRADTLKYEQPTAEQLVLSGRLADHAVRMRMRWRDPDKFPLRSRGFHWVQEYPYNR